MPDQNQAPPLAPAAPKGRYLVLLLLILVYTINFLDRQIISILAVPIKNEFNLADDQLGLLGGIAFGLVYSILAIPVAWLADRFSRSWIMTTALVLWSGFTAMCGMATSFAMLFVARMGVGVGEAGGVAPAYSLIADYFPPKSRAKALAIYSFGIPIGAAAGILYGGLIAKAFDWRIAFISIGLFGVLLAPLFKMIVKDPKRGFFDQAQSQVEQISPLKVLGIAFSKPSFWLLSFGAGCSSLVGYGLMFWLPSFLTRTFKLDLVATSYFLSTILFFAGVTGMFLGGVIADRLGQKSKGAYALIPALAFIISAPLYALGVMAKTPHEAFLLFFVPQALGLVWLGPVLNAVQHLGPAVCRTTMSSLFLLINNLIGLGVGPWFFGKMSTIFSAQYGEDSIKYAFLAGLGFYVLSAFLLLLASFRLKKDWVD